MAKAWWDRLLDGPLGYVILLVMVIGFAVVIKNDLGRASTPAEKLCEAAKAEGLACRVSDAQMVETEDGSIFLIWNGKVHHLQ